MNNKFKYIVFIVVILILSATVIAFLDYTTSYTEDTYALSEIDDGVYAIYHTTHSRVPSENYEVITLCCNNSIYTLDGNVSITFTDKEPYVYIKDTNYSHEDEIYVYIPKGTVKYEASVNVGR